MEKMLFIVSSPHGSEHTVYSHKNRPSVPTERFSTDSEIISIRPDTPETSPMAAQLSGH